MSGLLAYDDGSLNFAACRVANDGSLLSTPRGSSDLTNDSLATMDVGGSALKLGSGGLADNGALLVSLSDGGSFGGGTLDLGTCGVTGDTRLTSLLGNDGNTLELRRGLSNSRNLLSSTCDCACATDLESGRPSDIGALLDTLGSTCGIFSVGSCGLAN